jgi:hypothetical protein
MAPKVVAPILIVVGIVLMVFFGMPGFVLGLACILGGVIGVWAGWVRKRRAVAP